MRIGIGGLSCECSTFSSLLSTARDFEVTSGDALLADYDIAAEFENVELVPLTRARALPGGPIDKEFYDEFKIAFGEAAAGIDSLDGLLLDMHGAASVVGIDDAEADFYSFVRGVTGTERAIAASYDLHGNLSREALLHLDILTAYRTAPHVDRPRTIRRALDLLVRRIRRGRKPARAFVPIPILLPGEKTSTEFEPAKSLYLSLPRVVEEYGLFDASILIGYAWADEPRAMASVVAFGDDPARAHEAASKLARRFWDNRSQFDFGVFAGAVDECIRTAMHAGAKPVVISDSGDNPTAGGAGDVPFVLERLIDLNATGALYASIADAEAVERCRRTGVNNEITVTLGGKLDPVHGNPLEVTGTVISIRGDRSDATAVIRARGTDIIVTSKRKPFHSRDDFLDAGVDTSDYGIIVVKIGYLVPGLREIAARALLAMSPGAVSQDFNIFSYDRIERPLFPFDRDMEWQPPRNSIV